MAKRVHVFVSGEVQGVNFRWYCRNEASARGVGGFVRNLPDGRVEAAFEGDSETVDAMVQWCRHGPPSARVRGIDVTEEEPTGNQEFVIAR
ncbi:MAG: acylphosphatase [Actinomycetota bacterium]|nr:acylphosphatase [Actinomycetota bacterium]